MAKFITKKPVNYRGNKYGKGEPIDVKSKQDAEYMIEKGQIYPNRTTKEDKARYGARNKAYAVKNGSWYYIKREGETLEKVQGKENRDKALAKYNGDT